MLSEAWPIVEADQALRLLCQAAVKQSGPWQQGEIILSVGSTELFRPREHPPQYPYGGLDLDVTITDATGPRNATVDVVSSLTSLTIETPLDRRYGPTDPDADDFAIIALREPPLTLGTAAAITTGRPWSAIDVEPDALPAITVRILAGQRADEAGGQRILRQYINAQVAYARDKQDYDRQEQHLQDLQTLCNLLHSDPYCGGAGMLSVIAWAIDDMDDKEDRPFVVATADVRIEVQAEEWS